MSLITSITNKPEHSATFTVQTFVFIAFFIYGNVTPVFANDQQHVSKRIEVYDLSQNYWDTQQGDTLSEITYFLLPNNPAKREALKQDIVQLNPTAFINGDPATLLAGKRLWLPGHIKQADSIANPAKTTVETYSWGNIKRPKNQ